MNRLDALALFYSGIVAMQFHPGVKARLSPEDCMSEAMKYFLAFDESVQVSPKGVQ